MRFKTTALKEKESVEYGYEKTTLRSITPDFEDEMVFLSSDSYGLEKSVGVVENSEYVDSEGIIVDGELVDEDMASLVEKGEVSFAPRLILGDFTSRRVEGVDGMFATPDPEYMVGETEIVRE